MRLPRVRLWHSFPELDPFDDAACRRFVRATRFRFIWRRVLRTMLILPLAFALWVVILMSASYPIRFMYLLGVYRFDFEYWSNARIISDVLPFVISATLCAGLPGVALLVIRDRDVRYRIRSLIKRCGTCRNCSYKLLGLAVSDAMTVTCPECGLVTKIDPALTTLSGRARDGVAVRVWTTPNDPADTLGTRRTPSWITWRLAHRLALVSSSSVALLAAIAAYFLWIPMTQPLGSQVDFHSQTHKIRALDSRIHELEQPLASSGVSQQAYAFASLRNTLERHLPFHRASYWYPYKSNIWLPTQYARLAKVTIQHYGSGVYYAEHGYSYLYLDPIPARQALRSAVTQGLAEIDDTFTYILHRVLFRPYPPHEHPKHTTPSHDTYRTETYYGATEDNYAPLLHALCHHRAFSLDQPRGLTTIYALLANSRNTAYTKYAQALDERSTTLALIRGSLASWPPDAASLRTLAAYVEETALPEPAHMIELSYLRAIRNTYMFTTDDGRGNGYQTLSPHYASFRSLLYSDRDAIKDIMSRYNSVFLPRRRALEAKLTHAQSELVSLVSKLPADRDTQNAAVALAELSDALIVNDAEFRLFARNGWFAGLPDFLATIDHVATLEAGTRTMLAIELHRADHGDYPASLASVDSRLRWLVHDDPTTGRPFVYKRLASDPLNAGRQYTLYALDSDGIDHGGIPFTADNSLQVFFYESDSSGFFSPSRNRSVLGVGANFVFNLPLDWLPTEFRPATSAEPPTTTQTGSDPPAEAPGTAP